ncbi:MULTISPECIES: hypothetical protein [Priestia]|uniref:hypothetical protein n=1 Tax=Priestia TaxID=2800373 RepID=UPI00196A3D61|nr:MULTISPECIES: hypothetical protein [Priestia]MCW1048965.1 hypothetical protein [Priestia sp. JV24]QSF42065.1 hypothetical protein ICR96_29320 [Priestia megaterium]
MNLKINNEDDFKNILQFTGKCLEKIGDMFINKAFVNNVLNLPNISENKFPVING